MWEGSVLRLIYGKLKRVVERMTYVTWGHCGANTFRALKTKSTILKSILHFIGNQPMEVGWSRGDIVFSLFCFKVLEAAF